MALWKAVADRHDLLLATWDSGRVGAAERERLSTLVWGRLDASLDPRLAGAAASNGVPGSGSALAVSLPEACRLSDALAASLRVRLSVDPADADVTARVRSLRAQVERIRDLVGRRAGRRRTSAAPTGCSHRLDGRVADLAARASAAPTSAACSARWRARPRSPSATSSSAASRRREDARDEARARALRTELEARGAALRDLAARCVAAVHPAPRFAVPDVAALGPVPHEPAAVDAYLARLETVGRALTAGAGGLRRVRSPSATSSAAGWRLPRQGGRHRRRTAGTAAAAAEGRRADLAELYRRTRDVLDHAPADLARAEALLAAYQAYLGSGPRPAGRGGRPMSTTTSACTQPGCTGHILDGYCDVCGSPRRSAAARVRHAAGAPGRRPRPHARIGGDVAAGVGDAPSTASRASNRLASTALGSARAGRGGTKVTRRVGTSSTSAARRPARRRADHVPPVPAVDAAKAILKNPMVPEDKRHLPVLRGAGRALPRRPARAHRGLLPDSAATRSRSPPSCRPGDLVGGQYEVAGAIAHGGLGWIYLARDRNVSDRWVVLKGLLNSGDPDALAAAIAERQFLAQVEHPLIVEIYNFVTHEGAGYIVMEYVGGTSLKQLLKDRMRAAGGSYDPLPVDQAIAYVIEVLPAFQYLHDLGLVYCDFKPDNLIQVGDAVKLIDLGGVRRLDDHDSAIYGTVGYQAPEVPQVGTVGRLRHLHDRAHADGADDGVPRLPEHVRRLAAAGRPRRRCSSSTTRSTGCWLKACAPDPADRFASADELRVQLLGVLREVVARDARRARPQHSTSSLLFEAPAVTDDALDWQRPARAAGRRRRDPQAAWLRTVSVDDPAAAARRALRRRARRRAPRCCWPRARAALEAGRPDRGRRSACTSMLADDPWEWRAVWMSGLAALPAATTAGRAERRSTPSTARCPASSRPSWRSPWPARPAASSTSPSRSTPPAPRTDANYIAPAAFGLARIRAGRGDVDGARRARSTWCRRPAAPSPRPGAGGPGCWPTRPGAARAGRGDGQHRRPDHRPARPRPLRASTCCRRP